VVELFPTGGGGYLVASKLLSPRLGMVSGCALLIDYVLTIAISVSSGTDALFSFLPAAWQVYKLHFAVAGVGLLIFLNLRGVKESVTALVPVFLLFVATHLCLILYAVGTHAHEVGAVASGFAADWRATRGEIGLWGIAVLLLRAYSMGAGTYTGIEAVSCGVNVLREPRVRTAKLTMQYMAASLSFVVVGLMLAYLLFEVVAQPGKTLNASVCERVVAGWPAPWGQGFLWATLFSEAALLFVAAQTGFIGGPNVLATMAKDSWVPYRFALLSNRLVVQNGILLMGAAAVATLLLTRASVHFLVVLYSINVFIDFSLSQIGILRHTWTTDLPPGKRLRTLAVVGGGLALTLTILVSVIVLKFHQGAWITLATTGALAFALSRIRREYRQTTDRLERLNDLVEAAEVSLARPPSSAPAPAPAADRTAVLLVNGYSGIGLHSLLAIQRLFGETFRRYVFLQVGVVDAGTFKGVAEVDNLEKHTQSELDRYVRLMKRRGYEAEGQAVVGMDVVEEVSRLAPAILKRFPSAVFFGGQLVFRNVSFFSRLLHNFTVFDIQRQLYQQGVQFILLPIRV
jgi:hypothetical protein